MGVSEAARARAADALARDDALGLAGRVVGGEFSAQALLEACLARIASDDPGIGAVCRVNPDLGRAGALAVDEAVVAVAGRPDAQRALLQRWPFAGVPLLLKDLSVAALGLPSSFGSRLFDILAGGPVHWPLDSTLVSRYRAAGFVPFGRTTTPEFGISASTEAAAYGAPTRNPWRRSHSAGGSSGGAAAAVAAGMVPLAHASDGAGSIRIPASCCGLVGFKPSRALMPNGPLHGEAWGGFATEHVLTRTVRDSAVALAVSSGGDVGAAYRAPALDRAALRAGAAGRGPWRIAVVRTHFDGGPVNAAVAAAVDATAQALAGVGAAIEPIAMPVTTEAIVETVIRTMAVWTAAGIEAACAAHGRDPSRLPEDALEPSTRGAWALGRSLSGPAYVGLIGQANRLVRAIAERLEPYDALLLPTLAEPPALLGRFRMDNPDYLDYRLGPNGVIHYSPFTPLANLTGQPAVSLPVGDSGGLPIGVQLVGRLGGDVELLALAARIETLLPWHARRPLPRT